MLASFAYWYLPYTNTILMFFNALFYLGNILFFDYLSVKFSGYSLLKLAHRREKFIILGLVFGIMLEFFAHWVGKLWYFPHWDTSFYIIILIPGFAFYSFYLIETYLGTKAVLEYFFAGRQQKVSFKGLKKVFVAVGLFGAIGISSITTVLVLNSPKYNSMTDFFSINHAVLVTSMSPFVYLALGSLFLWLFLEYIEFELHETSLLYEMLKGNYWPFVSVLLAGWIAGFIDEVINAPGQLWSYSNWPVGAMTFYHIPIIVVLAWPLHYLPVFSLYRILFKKDTVKLWE